MFKFSCPCGAEYSTEQARLGVVRIRCSVCGSPITIGLDHTSNTQVESVPNWVAADTTSFEQCIAFLRVLIATPAQSSHHTTTEPWTFAPPCLAVEVDGFQNKHKVELPPDYVRFVTEFGNGTKSGGAFPIFALGMTLQEDDDGSLIPFVPSQIDALSQTFTDGLATWAGAELDDEINDYIADNGEPPPAFDADVMPGSMPIAYRGCGEWCYLSLTGPHAGKVWEFSNGWMNPVPTQWLRPVNFCEWIVGEVALQRGLIEQFRQFAGTTAPGREISSQNDV